MKYKISKNIRISLSPAFILATPAYVSAASMPACVTGGVLAPFLEKGITELQDLGMNWVKAKLPGLFGKFTSTVTGITKVPVYDSRVEDEINNQASKTRQNTDAKEKFGDVVARCLAREIFNRASKDLTNMARTGGRDGGTTFIQNWRNYLTGSQYRGESIFRTILSNTKVCKYMETGVKQGFGVTKQVSLSGLNTRTGSTSPFQLTANCSMPSSFSMDGYMKDFSGNGGWEAFNRLLETQNNPLGMALLAGQEISNQRNLEQQADQAEALANNGYQGISGKNASDSCALKDERGRCIKYKDIKTPGSYVAANLAAVVQQELAWITNVDELSEMIASGVDILINRLGDLSNPNEGDYTTQPIPSISPLPTLTPTPGTLECSTEGPFQYGRELSVAIDTLKSQNPNFLNSVPVLGGNPRHPEEISYPQTDLDKTAAALISIIKSNMSNFRGGRIYTSCEPGGSIGTDAIIFGKDYDVFGEVYDFKSGTAESDGRPLRDALQTSDGGELTDWARVVPD